MKQRDLTGQRFGRWIVLHKTKDIPRNDYKEACWLCRCECGTEREVRSRLLLHKTQNSRSCGCARTDSIRTNPPRLSHGYSKTHRLYPIWKAMRQRCTNPNNRKYPRYGGRGIYVCDRWGDFQNFLDDMEPSFKEGLTIDRIENDGPYAPNNCRWATLLEQAQNRGRSKYFVLDSRGYSEQDLICWEELPDIINAIEQLLKLKEIDLADVDFYEMLGNDSVIFSYDIKE